MDSEIGVENDGQQDCNVNLTKYIFVFALFQVVLSQIPSFHHLWYALAAFAATYSAKPPALQACASFATEKQQRSNSACALLAVH